MMTSRFAGPLALLLGGLVCLLPTPLPLDYEPWRPWLAVALCVSAMVWLRAIWRRFGLAMPWVQGLVPQNEGNFLSAPPARRVSIRIVCQR